jgi:hypothetical protein
MARKVFMDFSFIFYPPFLLNDIKAFRKTLPFNVNENRKGYRSINLTKCQNLPSIF